jgi:hypothetical protein
MRLEVIADDVYFEPWASDFTVKTNKKVNVVVAEQVEDKPRMKVQVIEQKEEVVKKPIVTETKKRPVVQTSKNQVNFTKEEFLKKLLG